MLYEKETNLLDSWRTSGNSFEELRETLRSMTKHTKFLRWHSADVELLSFIDERTITKEDGEIPVVASYLLTPGNLPTSHPDRPFDSDVKAYRIAGIEEKLIKEWTNEVKLAIVFNDDNNEKHSKVFYLTSTNALQTMDRFGLAGDAFSHPSLERDLLIAKCFEKDLGVTVIARVVNGKKKIFSILSDKYAHLDQDVIFDVVEEIEKSGEMGEAKCHNWEVSNFFTKLYVEFPKKAEELSTLYGLKREMIPGLLITTSDTGDSSFSVKGTWRIGSSNSLIINGEVKRKHSGKIDTNEILKDVSEKIFAEYAKLPEALCNLASKDITDPSWDLTTTAGLKANQAEVENVIKTAFKRLNIVKAIRKETP